MANLASGTMVISLLFVKNKHETIIFIYAPDFLMTYTFKRKLMYTNKSPRRIDRRAGARNKKIILKSYQTIKKNKKNQ
jgi:hypothetical protein